MVKEYAYKLVIPEIRCKGEKVHAEDMSNLRARILAMIEDYPESRQALAEVVQNDQEIGGILETDTFTSDLIKFEKINNSPNDLYEFSSNDIRVSKYHLILRYSHHFNVPPMPKHIRLLMNGTTKSKNVMEEFWSIFDDFNKITDESSLHIIGPPLIQRCENILSRQPSNDILPVYAAGELYDRAALCTIALKYGNPPQISDELYYSEYTNYVFKTYKIVSIPKYKYASIYTLKNYTWQFNKYDEFLNHALFVKKDAFNKLDFEDKIGLISNIVELIKTNLPPQENYFKIGLENCHDFISLVKYNQEISDDWKLIYIYNCNVYSIAEIYNKNGFVDEALFELDYVINAKPPSSNTENSFKSMVDYAKKKREEWIVNTDYPYTIDVDIFNVDDESHPIELSDGKTVEVFAVPYNINNDGYKNIINIKLKLSKSKSIEKKFPPRNLTLEISFEPIFENNEYITNFLNDPLQNGHSEDTFMYHRENEYGFIDKNNNIKQMIEISDKELNNINFKFQYTSFGGDKFRINISSLTPYNINKRINIEVWKKYILKLYAMNDKYYPNTKELNEKFRNSYVKFDFENHSKNVKYYDSIFSSYTSNVTINQIYYFDYIEELKKEGFTFDKQHKYVNVIGCNKLYQNDYENSNEILYGIYRFVEPPNYISTALIGYGSLSNINTNEIKTLSHEIGHAFALEHVYDTTIIPTYKHSDDNCIMRQGIISNGDENPYIYKNFCENCLILIRNGIINISFRYYTHGITSKYDDNVYDIRIDSKKYKITLNEIIKTLSKQVCCKILIDKDISEMPINICIQKKCSVDEILNVLIEKYENKICFRRGFDIYNRLVYIISKRNRVLH